MLTTDYYRWLLVLHHCSCYSLPVCCTQLDHTHGDVVQRTTCFRKNRMVLHSVVGLTSDSTQLAKLTVTQLQVINSVVEFDSTATNVGVVLDGQLSMSQQVTAVCRSCFYQLSQLKSVKSSLTREALHSLIQPFVHCRLDYCNSALAGVTKVYLHKLQSVENMAAYMVSGVHWSEHITPVLEDLHWLLANQRVVFKMALMVWKCVHGVTPAYLSDLCIPAILPSQVVSICALQRLALYWF